MKKVLSVLLLFQILSFVCLAQVKVNHLLTENRVNPLGLEVTQPRFSWQLTTTKRNVMQTAYELRVSENASDLTKGKSLIWNTGKVTADSSVHVAYQGESLASGKQYFWQVRIWDNQGKSSSWSEPAFWQMAFLDPASEFKAQWIEPGFQEDTTQRPSPVFRKEFSTQEGKKIASATAYITAHGLYEAQLNGQRIGDAYLTPGWTSYHKRLQYQVYDVSDLLQTGENAIGVTLASGWYRGYIGFSGQNNFYGDDIALLFQLDIHYTDGSSTSVISDGSWKSSTGPILSSEIYDGEVYDARKELPGWATVDFDDAGWHNVQVQDHSKEMLIATYNEPIRKHETFKPQRIFTTPSGETVVDFGQNLVGWVEVKVTGKAGDSLTLYHAEVLDKEGNFYTENLRSAQQKNTYLLKGGAQETFEPHFTFQGFRYVKIVGFPGKLTAENLTAVALYSDMKPIGYFTSSNDLLNQLQHNIQWGQKGNFLDVPTDCPQRDERLGWTGDAQVFFRTAAFNMNVHNFFTKWMKDVAADQLPNGSVPFVVPNVLGESAAGSAGWADAATIIPWNMYLVYGDKRILEEQYSSMKAWVDYIQQQSQDDLWNTGFHFGDWLFYRPDDDNDGRAAVTDKYLIAQCFYAHSIQLLINAAKVLGKTSDVDQYSKLLQNVKEAYLKEYVTPSGRLVSSTQTAYVLALNFDMLPEKLRRQAADRLAQNIANYDYHLTTGFLGTPYLCHVLSRFGHHDVAYKLLMQKTYPSWLYPVTMGATTIWERWDGLKPDSTFQTPSMNSFNHYAYGAIGDWMYRNIAGINVEEDNPGYKHILIKPTTGGGLSSAGADLQTYYGTVSSHWKVNNQSLALDIKVPANTRATVYIPASLPESVQENDKPIASVKDLTIRGQEGEYVVVELGSGNYHFSSQLPAAEEAKSQGR